MARIHDIAEEAAGWFEMAERPDGEKFARLKDGAPDWITGIVREAHGNMLPDDWRYGCIWAALEHIAESGYDEPGDGSHEFADGYVDTYNSERIAWLGSHLLRTGYVDDARAEGITTGDEAVMEQIGAGQYIEAQEVYGLVTDALIEYEEETSDE